MIHKILIIEDEQELATILQRFLTKKKFHVQTAQSLREGFQKLNVEPFDALILDNNLPDGKGVEHISDIKKIHTNIIVVAMSALQMREVALRAGADYFVEKPISLQGIEAVLVEKTTTPNQTIQAVSRHKAKKSPAIQGESHDFTNKPSE